MVHKKQRHKHEYEWSDYCGAYVCKKCGHHKGLARCFCGWNIETADPEAMFREEW